MRCTVEQLLQCCYLTVAFVQFLLQSCDLHLVLPSRAASLLGFLQFLLNSLFLAAQPLHRGGQQSASAAGLMIHDCCGEHTRPSHLPHKGDKFARSGSAHT